MDEDPTDKVSSHDEKFLGVPIGDNEDDKA